MGDGRHESSDPLAPPPAGAQNSSLLKIQAVGLHNDPQRTFRAGTEHGLPERGVRDCSKGHIVRPGTKIWPERRPPGCPLDGICLQLPIRKRKIPAVNERAARSVRLDPHEVARPEWRQDRDNLRVLTGNPERRGRKEWRLRGRKKCLPRLAGSERDRRQAVGVGRRRIVTGGERDKIGWRTTAEKNET